MSKYTVSTEQVLRSGCALLCEVLKDEQREVPPAKLLLHLNSISLFIHDFTVLARQVLVASAASEFIWQQGPYQAKRVMNQAMFEFPDPLVVHVLLSLCMCCSHMSFKYDSMCPPHSWYPQCDSPCFYVLET
jgi:hypothetical protein